MKRKTYRTTNNRKNAENLFVGTVSKNAIRRKKWTYTDELIYVCAPYAERLFNVDRTLIATWIFTTSRLSEHIPKKAYVYVCNYTSVEMI